MVRKLNSTGEAQRELVEANLGRLGTALVLLELVAMRVNVVIEHGTAVGTLKPASQDIKQIEALIRRTQQSL
jgi:hypothetical protein